MKEKYVSFIPIAFLGIEAVTSGRELSARDNPHLPDNEYPYEILQHDANLTGITSTASFSGPMVVPPFTLEMAQALVEVMGRKPADKPSDLTLPLK